MKKPSSDIKYQWVKSFKDIFLHQDKERLSQIFDIDNFGLHNGATLEEYIAHDFEEFSLKASRFDLNTQENIVVYDLKDDFFYFSFGQQENKTFFEAIFKFKNNKAIGNQYKFRVEAKIQFFKDPQGIRTTRKINLKGHIKVKKVLNTEASENNIFIKNDLEEILGGHFYSHIYTRLQEDNLSYWDSILIVSEKGMIKHDVLMRGKDHHLFKEDLFPEIINDGYAIKYNKNVPVIIYTLLENGEEQYIKYPEGNILEFTQKIKKVCLTDTLSFDWIVENN